MNTITNATRIENLLGGRKVLGHKISNDRDLHEISKLGITKKSLIKFSEQIHLSIKDLSTILHITPKTIQRKQSLERFNTVISEHLLMLAQLYARGKEVLNSEENFQTWLTHENIALGNEKPIELLSTIPGMQMVMDELGRIEHGVFA